MNIWHENVAPQTPEYNYDLLYLNTIMHTMKEKKFKD